MSVTSIAEHQSNDQDPSQDIPAEMSVLGGMMLSRNAIADVTEVLGTEHFYRPAHATIYERVLDMYLRSEPADAITVSGELERRGELQRVGGAPYLHTLIATVPTATNVGYYAEQVLKAAARRLTGEVGAALSAYAANPSTDTTEVLDRARDRITTAVDYMAGNNTSGSAWGDLLQPTMDELDNIATGNTKGLSTGFADLDDVTNGLHPGQLITIAARPGVGKSTLASDFCRSAAIKQGVGAVLFSLEMGKTEIMMRALSAETKVRLTDMRGGKMTEDDWNRIGRRMTETHDAPLHIEDAAGLSAAEINARAHKWARSLDGNLGLIVVDYMQLMSSGKKVESRQVEVSEFSRNLKLLAKELDVPVVALSQLNRSSEQRADKKPQLSDLRESGSIEQDSDMVILIHRPDAIERDDPRMGEADFNLAKNRSGPVTTVTVAHQLHYGRFVDMAHE